MHKKSIHELMVINYRLVLGPEINPNLRYLPAHFTTLSSSDSKLSKLSIIFSFKNQQFLKQNV